MSGLSFSMQLLTVALTLSACGGSSTTGDLTEEADVVNGTPGEADDSTDDPLDDLPGVVIEPATTHSDNAVFAGLAYKEARAELDRIVTGAVYPEAAGIENYFAFALEPSAVGDLVSGVTTDCALDGTVRLEYDADGMSSGNGGTLFTSRNHVFDNCRSEAGLIDGVITIRFDDTEEGTFGTERTTTTFDVYVSQNVAIGTLKGQVVSTQTSSYLFNPLCGSTGIVTQESTLTLENTTLMNTFQPAISHYYSTLSHSQTDVTDTTCEGESLTISYSSNATYSRTNADTVKAYEIIKAGRVLSMADDAASMLEPARLEATVTTSVPETHSLSLLAADPLGSSLVVTIDSGGTTSTFTDELDFRNLQAM